VQIAPDDPTGDPVSKPRSTAARQEIATPAGVKILPTAIALLLVLAGIAYVIYYVTQVYDDQTPKQLADLKDWNWAIGFGLILLGLAFAARPSTPLGRGRGVVVGMLGCFLLGLLWIVVYYVTSQDASVPLVRELGNYNLIVGVAFMAVGFIYATHWE
jgi:magnesium-transporting ATPase (P-type)